MPSIIPDPSAPLTPEREQQIRARLANKARAEAKIAADAEATHWRRLGMTALAESTIEQAGRADAKQQGGAA